MNRDFIPHEEALALKELGFDEECMASRDINDGNGLIQLPLYQQAFRWFREEYDLYPRIAPYISDITYKMVHDYVVFDINWGYDKDVHLNYRTGEFNTYEEAELACLKKLIEIVKNK